MNHSTRWTARKIAQRLVLITPLVHRRAAPLPPFRYLALSSPLEAPPLDDTGESWEEIAPNTYWGAWNTNFVLRTTFQVPADWDASIPIGLYLPLGESGDFSNPESLAYIDGKPYATGDRHHQEFLLPDAYRDGKPHDLVLHGWTGNGRGDAAARLLMRQCNVVQIDQTTREFVAATRVSIGSVEVMDENATARGRLLTALDQAFTILDTREPFGEEFYTSVPAALAALREGIKAAGSALDVDITASGHAHIDVAWLWTLGQTRRKAGRTFHTVMRLMEQFPEYHFTQSQPQLYDYVRQDYPELFEAIKQRVAEGRWEPIGDMWIEADCNLSGAESLARQFLLGRTFFDEHFGRGTGAKALWLPDVFGYAWALPQLIKQAGLDYFFTIKIGWNQYNRLPFDSFWWQGLDGTRVLTHFSTTPEAGSAYASTYNANATPQQVMGTWTNAKQKDLRGLAISLPQLMAFGYGDGGGGPTREMLENIREFADFPGMPRMHQGDVETFFRNLEATAGEHLPTWNAELYFEYHRGTYTTQSRNKRSNRKSEFLLHDAEFVATLAALADANYTYPVADLRKAWELVCLNQFHDIIPGSSIGAVYEDSARDYAEIRRLGESARDAALASLAATAGGDLLLVNPTSFARNDLALWAGQLADGQTLQRDGAPLETQAIDGGTLIAVGDIAPYSVAALALADERPTTNDQPAASTTPASRIPHPASLTINAHLLENDYLRVELNDAGDITRVYDKLAAREVLAPNGIANQFQAFEDRPMNWDAWDVDIFYDDKQWLAEPAESVEVVEEGPLRATLAITRRILHSSYTQRISISRDSARLDFDTVIDWRERHTLLKVAFPVDIFAPVATYDIQWGNVQRPTHRNTSWDWARFETCAHKWVDLSEGGYGVSVLNDCKYGHDIHDNVMRITLLRSPTMPDPEADQGEHRFAYSLLPHADDWKGTIAAGYVLNDPLIVYGKNQEPGTKNQSAEASANSGFSVLGSQFSSPVVAASSSNIVIETVKRAEDGNGIIVRLYESQRRRGPVELRTSFALQSAEHTNLLERNATPLDVTDNSVQFSVKPYEIVTLRLVAK